MSLRDWLQSSNSSGSSESLQGLCSFASCSAPTAFAASRPMSKRKSAYSNHLGVDDPKQVRLRAYPVSMFDTNKRYFNVVCCQR